MHEWRVCGILYLADKSKEGDSDVRLLRKIFKKDALLYKTVLLFVLATAIMISVLTAVFGTYFEQILQEEKFNNASKNLTQVSNILQFREEYAQRLLQQIQQDKEFEKLFSSGHYDSNQIMQSLNRLDYLRMTIPNIFSIYIYNQEEDIVYNSSSVAASRVNKKEYFTDQGFAEILGDMDKYEKNSPIFRTISSPTIINKDYSVNVYTYILYERYNSGKINNIVALNFDAGWIKEGLGYIQNQDFAAEDIRIINKSGQITYSSDKKELGTSFSDEKILEQILAEGQSGYFVTEDQQLVTYVFSENQGYADWIFMSMNDFGIIMQPINHLKLFIYGCSILLFLISVVGVIFLSVRLYLPIKSRLSTVEMLEIERQKKLVMDRRLYLKKLVYGNAGSLEEEIKKQFKELDIQFGIEGGICLSLVSIDYLDSFKRKYGYQTSGILESILEMTEKSFGKYFEEMFCVEIQEGMYAVVIRSAEIQENKHLKLIGEVIDDLNKTLEERLQTTISISVSQYGESVSELPFMLSEVLNVQANRYLLGFGTILCAEDILKEEPIPYEYPKAAEKNIITNLFKGRLAETLDAYEVFFQEIKQYSVDEIKISFLQLSYAIKYYSQNTMAERSNILIGYEDFTAKIQSLKTIQAVTQLFYHLFEEMIENMENLSRTKYETLIEQVKERIAKDYGDMNFSINDAAEEAGISAAYLGRLFKRVVGVPFTEYLTGYRLDEACRLLLNTEMTINEISEATGFTNSSYFYVLFRKNLQCTPNQYRKNT